MRVLLTITASLLVILSLLVSIGIPLPFSFIGDRLEQLAGSMLGREVRIEGPSRLVLSLHPSLTVGDLSIGNPADWDMEEPFLTADHGTASVDLLALLRGQIRIETFELETVSANLKVRADQQTNFAFAPQEQTGSDRGGGHEFAGLDRVSLTEITIDYQDELSGSHYELFIEQASGSGTFDTPLQLAASGKFAQIPYALAIEGGTLSGLLRGDGVWPLSKGRLNIGDVILDVGGSLNLGPGEQAGYGNIALGGQNLHTIGGLFGFDLPDVGDFAFTTDVDITPGALQLLHLKFEALNNSLSGDLNLSLHGDRPLLGGTVVVSISSPESLIESFTETSPMEGSKQSGAVASTALPWHLLGVLDTDLTVRVADISSDTLALKDIKAIVSLVDGELIIPVAMELFNLQINGFLEAEAGDSLPAVSGKLASTGGDLSPLFDLLKSDSSLDGHLGSVMLNVGSTGTTSSDLIEAMKVSLELGDSAFSRDGYTVLTAETLSFDMEPETSAVLGMKGELLDRPLDLHASLAESSLNLDLQACDTQVAAKTRKISGEGRETEFDLSVEGVRACGLVDPLARFFDADLGYSLTASGSLKEGGLELDLEHCRVGDTRANGHLELRAGEDDIPLLVGEIHSPRIDIVRIMEQMEAEKQTSVGADAKTQPPDSQAAHLEEYEQSSSLIKQILAMEIMPVKHYLNTDVNLKIGVEEIINGMIGVSDVEITIEAEKGKLGHSPFQARIGGSMFTGSAALDLRDEIPSAHLDLATDSFSLPELLEEFDLAQLPEVNAAHIGLNMSFEGRTVKEMLLQAHYYAHLREGRVVIDRPPLLPLVLDLAQANYVAYPYQPAMISMNGELNSLPLHLESTSSGFFARGTEKPVILSLQSTIGDNRLEIDGQINRQKENPESFRLSSFLSGTRLDTLNDILGLDLPPLGPYQLEGTLASRAEKSVGLYDMGIRIGDSYLGGELIMTGSPGEDDEKVGVQSRLEARKIQLNDFQLGQWSPVTGSRPVRPKSNDSMSVEEESSIRTYDLLSREVAEKIDGTLEIVVQEVLSGQDKLGHGTLTARLEQGEYVLDELQLGIPGGIVQIRGGLHPQGDKTEAELLMNVEDFDYGILARRRQPESNLKGRLNLVLELKSEVEGSVRFNDNLNGRFRFGIIPEEFKAGALDLWAVNILTAVLPILSKGSRSVVNCLVGDFVLEHSLMQPETFVLDTSNMRVSGKGTVDVKNRKIDFTLTPTPKSAQFLSLSTPVAVSGSLQNPDIGVSTAGVIGTILRQPLSIISVPFQWLFTDNLERDGATVCSAAMQSVTTDIEGDVE